MYTTGHTGTSEHDRVSKKKKPSRRRKLRVDDAPVIDRRSAGAGAEVERRLDELKDNAS